MVRRVAGRPENPRLFNFRAGNDVEGTTLGDEISSMIAEMGFRAAYGIKHSSHSLLMGDFTEVLNQQFYRAWILQRMAWASKTM